MKKKMGILLLLIIGLVALNFILKVRQKNIAFVDIGEPCSIELKNIDFSMEITGLLNEDPMEYTYYDDNVYMGVSGSGEYSNKLMRWGISRREKNMTPKADPGAPELIFKYGGVYLGDVNKNLIYLTFDEGYENGYTPKILDVLKVNNVKAAFFITGPYLKEHSDLVERMIDEGHIVGNHTVNHPSLPSIENNEIEEEIKGLSKDFEDMFNETMKFVRPPKGEYSERTLAVTNKMGYTNLFWSFAYDDWYKDKVRGSEYAFNKVMNNLHNGAVILLHAVSKDNADAMDMIIKGARERGFEFGDCNDLIQNQN